MSAAAPLQLEMIDRPAFVKPPAVCRELIEAIRSQRRATPGAETVTLTAAEKAAWERRARMPIVPLSWCKGSTQVTPDDPGEVRKAGRPKLMTVKKTLTVNDLDNSLSYIQRRTREVSKLVKDSQPSTEHTHTIIRCAIKDAIRKLSMALPEENRAEFDEACAKL